MAAGLDSQHWRFLTQPPAPRVYQDCWSALRTASFLKASLWPESPEIMERVLSRTVAILTIICRTRVHLAALGLVSGPDCHQGASRIFSPRRDGLPMDTIEITYQQNLWGVRQAQQRNNEEPTPEEMEAARQAAHLYTAAWRHTAPDHSALLQ